MSFGDVLLLGILMGLSSFLIGSLPFLLPASRQRRWCITMGVGVLLGTAFVVILPEGIHTMYQPPRAPRQSHAHTTDTLTPTDAPSTLAPPSPPSQPQADVAGGGWTNPLAAVVDALPAVGVPDEDAWKTPLDKFKHEQQPSTHAAAPAAESQPTARKPAAAVGDDGADARRRLLATGAAHDHPAHSGTHGSRFVDVPVDSPEEVAKEASPPPKADGDQQHEHEQHEHEHEHAHVEPASPPSTNGQHAIFCFSENHGSKLMGMSLALGFVAMILIDRCTGRAGAANGSNGSPMNDIESVPLMAVPSATSSSRGGGSSSIELKSRSSAGAGNAGGGGGGGGGTLGAQQTLSNLSSPELRPLAALSAGTPTSSKSAGSVHGSPSSVTSSGGGGGGVGGSHPNFPPHVHAHVGGGLTPSASDPTVMLGPFAHALVDGCCIGAWAVGVEAPLVFTRELFVALVLHKAPVAFGVASFLLYQGRSVASVRKQLLLYSLAAPVAALAFSTVLGRSDVVAMGDGSARGLALLFAGGCLLFTIAVHILPEIQSQHGGGHSTSSAAGAASAKVHDEEEERGHGHGGGGGSSSTGMVLSPQGVLSRVTSPNPRPSSMSHLSLEDASPDVLSRALDPPGDGTIPWRYVWALIVGLLVPMACSYIQERKQLI